jgi:hypothetical protein
VTKEILRDGWDWCGDFVGNRKIISGTGSAEVKNSHLVLVRKPGDHHEREQLLVMVNAVYELTSRVSVVSNLAKKQTSRVLPSAHWRNLQISPRRERRSKVEELR